LVLVLVVIAAFAKQPPNVWSATDIVLYFLTALLCTLVAISFAVTGFAAPLARTEQTVQPLAAEITALRDEQVSLCDVVIKGNQEVSATVSQLQRNQRVLRDQFTRFADHLQTMTSSLTTLSEAWQAQSESARATLTELAAGQNQLTTDMRQVVGQTQALAKNVTSIAGEQTELHNTARANSQMLTGNLEAIQQSQTTLQTQIKAAAEAGKQTLAAVSEMAAGQTAAHETNCHVVTGVSDIEVQQAALAKALQSHTEATKTALTELAAAQERLSGDVRQITDLAQTLARNVADTVSAQVGARSTVPEDRQALAGGFEAIQQSQRTLQTQIEAATEAGRQTLAAVSGMAAQQAAVRETAERVVAGQGQLTSDVRQVADLAQTLVKNVTTLASDQVQLHSTVQSNSQALGAGIEMIQQNQSVLDARIAEATESGQQVLAAVTGMAAEQTITREVAERIVAEVSSIEAQQSALGGALQMHAEASRTATTVLTAGQGQLSSDVQYVTQLAQTLVENVNSATGEQVAACNVLQESAKVIAAGAETIQQNQKALERRIEAAAESGEQTRATVHGTLRDRNEELSKKMMAILESQVAMNTALGDLSQTASHIVGQVAGMQVGQTTLGDSLKAHDESTKTAAYALTAGQGQLSTDIRQIADLTHALVRDVTDIAGEQTGLHNTVRTSGQTLANGIEAIQQNQQVLQAQVGEATDAGRRTLSAVTTVSAQQVALVEAAKAADDELMRKTTAILESQLTLHTPVNRLFEAAEHLIGEVTGIGVRQDSLKEALQTQTEATEAGMAELTAVHGLLNSHVQHIEELTRTVAGNVDAIAHEQAAMQSTLQDSGRILVASAEAIQENQRTLQTQLEDAAEGGKQILAGVNEVAAEQAAAHETVVNRHEELNKRLTTVMEGQLAMNTDLRDLGQTTHHIVGEVTGIIGRQTAFGEALQAHSEATNAATIGLTAGQDQLSDGVEHVTDMVQTLVKSAADITAEQTVLHGNIQTNHQALTSGIETVQQNQRTLQTHLEEAAATGKQTQATVAGIAAEQAVVHGTVQHIAAGVAGIETQQTAVGQTLQAHAETTRTVLAELTAGQGQLSGSVQHVTDLAQTLIKNTADIATEQVGLQSTVQTNHQSLTGGIEAVQQNQRTLQPRMDEAVGTGRQTLATVTGIATEQTALHGTVVNKSEELNKGMVAILESQLTVNAGLQELGQTANHVMSGVTDIEAGQKAVHETLHSHAETTKLATTELAAGHEQLSSDVRQVADMARTLIENAADIAGEQAVLQNVIQANSRTLACGIEVVQQNQKTLQTDLGAVAETGKQTLAAVTGISTEQIAAGETAQRLVAGVNDIEARQAAVGQALQGHAEAMNTATASLATGQRQLSGDVRQVVDMAQMLIKNAGDIAAEQAKLHNTVQVGNRELAGGIEAVRQNQSTLQKQVEETVEAGRQIVTTVGGIDAQQLATHQMLRAHAEATKTATASLAAGQGQLNTGIQQVTDLAETLIKNVTDMADQQASLQNAIQASHQVLAGGLDVFEQNQTTLQTQVQGVAETGKQTLATVATIAAEQTAARETARHIAAGVTGIESQQAAVGQTLQNHVEAASTATASLAAGQGQLSSDVRQITGLAQTLVKSITDVASEQAGFRAGVEADNQALANGIESVQENQRTLQTQIGEATNIGKQTLAAVTGISVEQTVAREAAQRIAAEVNGIETRQTALGEALQAHTEATNTTMAGLAAGQGQLSSDVRQIADLAHAFLKNAAELAGEQARLHGMVEADNQALAGGMDAIQQNQQALQTKVDTMAALAERHQTHLDTLNTIAQQVAAAVGAVSDRQGDLERIGRATCDELIAKLAALTEERQQWMEQFSAAQVDIRDAVESMSRLEQQVVDLPESLQPYIQGVTDLLATTSQHCVQLGDRFDQNIKELTKSVSHFRAARRPSGNRCAKARK